MPFLELADARLYYQVHGTGPWLVWAHGAGGNHLSWWQQIPEFASRYRCLLFSHRGWGLSTSAATPDPKLFAADLGALLDHLTIERATLVGQSMGGWTVTGVAVNHPERVERLVLTGTLGGLTDDAMLGRLIELHSSGSARTAPAGPAPGFDPHMALAPDFPQRNPPMTFLYDQIAALNPIPSPGFLAALLQLRYDAARLTMPVHFLHGDADRLFPLALAQAAHAKVGGATFDIIEGAGHSAYFEKADGFNHTLHARLRQN